MNVAIQKNVKVEHVTTTNGKIVNNHNMVSNECVLR